jgi:hypothetical protein
MDGGRRGCDDASTYHNASIDVLYAWFVLIGRSQLESQVSVSGVGVGCRRCGHHAPSDITSNLEDAKI